MRFSRIACLLAVALTGALPAAAQPTEARASLIRRAQVWRPTNVAGVDMTRGPDGPGAFAPGATVICDYEDKALDGNSRKFACLVTPADEVKVKFGDGNGEVFGEVAATRLLWALGFGADRMYPVRIVCRGCPEDFGPPGARPGERLIAPGAIERRIEGEPAWIAPGWSWQELDLIDERAGGATRAQRDALKLLAVFLQHTDSKPEQQRLVCLAGPASRIPAPVACPHPLLMLNDVGLTFGRASLTNTNALSSVNLEAWAATPLWKGASGCIGNLPRSLSGTLKDPVISEEGRRFLARLLAQLSDRQIHDLFAAARFDQIDRWVDAFKQKRGEIAGRRCSDSWSAAAPPSFGIGPVLWLQSQASPRRTRAANIISIFGYTPIAMALAVILAFGIHLRAGAALLLLLTLTNMTANATKIVVSLPRPDAVDARVQAFAELDADAAATRDWTFGGRLPNPPEAPEASADEGGFPSGHVAIATAFVLGLVFLFNWRWAWLGLAWIATMAWARMYLGRHFAGDVLGGFGVAVIIAGVGLLGLNLARLANRQRAWHVARRLLAAAAVVALLALAIGTPAPYDAGRWLGLAAGVGLIVRLDGVEAAASPVLLRAGRVVLSGICFGAAWWITVTALLGLGAYDSAVGPLLEGVMPALVLLPGPLLIERLVRPAIDRS